MSGARFTRGRPVIREPTANDHYTFVGRIANVGESPVERDELLPRRPSGRFGRSSFDETFQVGNTLVLPDLVGEVDLPAGGPGRPGASAHDA